MIAWYIHNENNHEDLDVPMIDGFSRRVIVEILFQIAMLLPKYSISRVIEYLSDDNFRFYFLVISLRLQNKKKLSH